MDLILVEIVLFILSAVGMFLFTAAACRLPSRKKIQNIGQMSTLIPGRESLVDSIIESLQAKISPMLKLRKDTSEKIQTELTILGKRETARKFIATCIAKGILTASISIPIALADLLPCFSSVGHLFVGIIALFPIAFGIAIGIGEYQRLNTIFKKLKNEIEEELPSFVSLIQQIFQYERNVPKLIEDYTKTDETALTRELKIVLADMKTGSTEMALVHMNTRINSIYLSETVRGLIAASRGENTSEYFASLDQKLSEEQDLRVKKHIMSLAPKIRRIAALNLANMTLIYLVPMLMSGLTQMGQIFSF